MEDVKLNLNSICFDKDDPKLTEEVDDVVNERSKFVIHKLVKKIKDMNELLVANEKKIKEMEEINSFNDKQIAEMEAQSVFTQL
ncbi:hypothetical protein H5410_000431 [Solanum commersonii]|uniref:Uncharacterized protein n=1 Tax=Solanum commersonii TaxID=4109 RepID=A0A9J6AWR7_SOLCO|nr:hypothetical protein H5410_000431 [Solanum commersonii]